jgi:hypothetical protein
MTRQEEKEKYPDWPDNYGLNWNNVKIMKGK